MTRKRMISLSRLSGRNGKGAKIVMEQTNRNNKKVPFVMFFVHNNKNTSFAVFSKNFILYLARDCQMKPLNILIWSIIERERIGNEKGV